LLETHGEYWWAFYELKFPAHLAAVCIGLGWDAKLREIRQTENPTRAFLEFASDEDKREDNPLTDLEPAEQAVFANLLLGVCYSMEAVGYFGLSVNQLLEKARNGDSSALFRAVSVDRCVLVTWTASRLIARKQLEGDKRFFASLFKRMKSPHAGRKQYADLRYFHEVLREVGALDGTKTEDLLQLVGDTLSLYPTRGEDPVKGLRTLFAAWGKESTR